LFALCVESSHQRGMGHLFRMLRFALFLREKDEDFLFFINDHSPALSVLNEHAFAYEVVVLSDMQSNWEQHLIQKDNIDIWVNDRLNTGIMHAQHVKDAGVTLVTFDDRGDGASMADLHVAALIFDSAHKLRGRKILSGVQYLILDKGIDSYRRQRATLKKIVVSMGGSDTYGVTLQVVEMLKKSEIPVTVIVGPGFEHLERLQQVMPGHFELRINVPSLAEAFAEFDLAVTSGGVTPFESCASGLPCIVVATEEFEVPVGEFIERMGAGIFAGYYKQMKKIIIDHTINIERMSKQAMLSIDTAGVDRIYKEIMAL